MSGKLFAIILFGISTFSGCVHTQLRWNTTHQAKSLTEIYEQQVLDNLAMFVHDPNSLPSFAYPNTGRSDVTDKGSIGSDTSWNRLGFSAQTLKLSGGRDMYQTWGLTPIYDPRRLELMRCAYQHSLVCAGLCTAPASCPNCDRIQRTFYLGDPAESYRSKDEEKLGLPDELLTWTTSTGRTTPACFQAVRWLHCGDKKSLPKGNLCLKKGHYCGTYVWLCPEGQDELTKLTMTILDYAFSPQAPKPSKRVKEVTWFLGTDGSPVAQEDAAQIIKATLPFDAVVRLKKGDDGTATTLPFDESSRPNDNKVQKEQRRDPVMQALENVVEPSSNLPPILSPRMGISPLELELQLRNPQGGSNLQ